MYGSYFFNCWGALFAFTIAFVVKIMEPFAVPSTTIIQSTIWAIVGFVVMYGVRLLVGYIAYTPTDVEFQDDEVITFTDNQQQSQILPNEKNSSIEFDDESNEEIAKVVRTMLNKEEVA